MSLLRGLRRVPERVEATERSERYQASPQSVCVYAEPVYTSRWDTACKQWVPIPPTPRSQCYGGGVFRGAKP
jgi:hypothetical protein